MSINLMSARRFAGLFLIGVGWSAAGAVYNASTGYVTLSYAGSGQRQSPLSSTAAQDTGNNRYFWSDNQAIHTGTNYYLNTWVRGIFSTAQNTTNHYEFLGGRLVMGSSCSIAWKTFSPNTYTFRNEGAIVQGGCTWLVNEAIARPVVIRGRMQVENSSSRPFILRPWGAEDRYPEGLSFSLEAAVVGDADQRMRVDANTSATFPKRGTVRLLGDMSQFYGTVEVASNRLFVCNETLTNAKLVKVEQCGDLYAAAEGGTGHVSKVTVDGTSSIGAAAANKLVVSDLSLADGACVQFGWNGSSAGCVEVTDAFAASGKIGVAPEGPVGALAFTNGPSRFAVLKVRGENAFSVGQVVRAGNISWFSAPSVPDDLPSLTFEVANEDGWTVLYVTAATIVMQMVDVFSGAVSSRFHEAATWSNGKAPAENAGCDFYSARPAYIFPDNGQNPYHFPGCSATFKGAITIWQGVTYEFDQLNLFAGAEMRAWMGQCAIAGKIRLIGNGTYRITHGNRTPHTWSADLSGAADMDIVIRVPDAGSPNEGLGVSTFSPTGINTNFTGKWCVRYASTSLANPTQYMVFAVCESRNLGAPFKTFQYDALTIRNWQALKAGRADSVLDDMTRGVYFEGNAQVLAPQDCTLALGSPITLSGTLHKSGTGTLALGCGEKPRFCGELQSATPIAGTNVLLVKEGWVKPLTTNGVDGLEVSFAGGGIRLDRSPPDAGVAAYGFWNTKWTTPFSLAEGYAEKVPVTIDMGDLAAMPSPLSRYAICTVAADKADAVKSLFSVKSPFKGYVTGVEPRANPDGTVTLLAVVRYGGLTVIVR